MNAEINGHIEEYLDYYCGLSHAPEFAVLLKGQWGSGKTWFISQYYEKSEKYGRKFLYISLYGMSTVSEIESKFFQLLHPILSSKGMAISGAIIKGLLRGALKVDLNSDNKEDGTWHIQVPEINLPDHLKDVNKSILIFDDLERCNIDLINLLGYINYFVEHQEMKVILIANEDKLNENKSYQYIKEKLIGRTFEVSPDFESALKHFIAQTDNEIIGSFLSENSILIKDLYDQAKYENLRSLKQIVLDFQRIFKALPERAQSASDLLKDFLKLLVIFSIEVRRAAISPGDISKLQEEYTFMLSKRAASRRTDKSSIQNQDEEKTSLQKILDNYSFLDLHAPFPSAVWWQGFFDRGIIDVQELEQSVSSSKYFQDEHTPDWIKLWHFLDLSDNDFRVLLEKIEIEYQSRSFLDLEVIKHVFGLFLKFSDEELYGKSKAEILEDSKKYIDDLKIINQLEPFSHYISLHTAIEYMTGSSHGLSFHGKEFLEFKEFCTYIEQAQRLVESEKMPECAQALLDAMQSNVRKFHQMICPSAFSSETASDFKYYETPILNYISPAEFIEKLLTLSREDQQYIVWSISERCKCEDFNNKLIDELDWLQSVQTLLLEESARRKGLPSGYRLELLNKHYLKEAIEKLNLRKEKLRDNQ